MPQSTAKKAFRATMSRIPPFNPNLVFWSKHNEGIWRNCRTSDRARSKWRFQLAAPSLGRGSARSVPAKPFAAKKACPRGAYLGLCEEGMVAGVLRGTYTRSKDNKQYAVRAAQLLQHNPGLATAGPEQLWDRVMEGNSKAHNSQMDVVLTLWQRGLLTPSSHDA